MAIATSTDVANLALRRIGQGNAISSIADTSDAAAVAANALYDLARAAVLEEVWWRFATKRAVLAQLAAVTRDGWGYVYDLPADCLAPQYIWSGVPEEQTRASGRVRFDLESDPAAADASKRILLCDVDPSTTAPLLVYTVNHTTPAQWPLHFVNAVTWRLAAELAVPLNIDGKRAALAFQRAAIELNVAAAAESRARQLGELQGGESEFITARG